MIHERGRQETVDTYNKSAADFVEHFRDVGPRTQDIDTIFNLLGNPQNANILEVGCGDGRDAQEIIRHGAHYLGVDISSSFIDIAQKAVPEGEFQIADIADFDLPADLDAVIAFASLLHLSHEENAQLFKKVHAALKPGGIFYVSVKYRPSYSQETQVDKFGSRLFYFYSEEDIQAMAGGDYSTEISYRKVNGSTEWLEMALRSK